MLAGMIGCEKSTTDEKSALREVAPVPWGTAMGDVARRFELLGKAADGERFDLADYELGEIEETFDDTLPHATPPREGHPEVLPALAKSFRETNIPDLKKAIAAHDKPAIASAFARTATACNGCHQASGHGFIEVPVVFGHAIPNTDKPGP